jgi:hypothetical protein
MYTGTKRLSDFVDTIYSRFFVAEHSKILLYTMFYVETNKLFIVLVLFLWFAIHLLVVQGSRLWGYPKEPTVYSSCILMGGIRGFATLHTCDDHLHHNSMVAQEV